MSNKKEITPEEITDKSETAITDETATEDGAVTDETATEETDEPNVAPEAANDGASEAERDGGKKRNRFAEFFVNWGSAIILLGALVFVCVLLGLAIGLKGDIYDKIAFVWVAAFVCEFVAYMKKKNAKTLTAMIITIVLAVCSAVAYGLELAEIIP